MKSAKIINKILLISLAFGGITFIAGMLVKNENTRKALMGTGAASSIAGGAIALVAKNQKKSGNGEDRSNQQLDSQIDRLEQLPSQEPELTQSVDESTNKIQTVEADINSFQPDHNQHLDVSPNLNSHTQLEQVISPIEENLVDLNIEEEPQSHNDISNESDLKNKQLVDSLESSELEVFNSEPETSQESIEHKIEVSESIEEVNPFVSSSEPSESVVEEDNADLEIVDKLIGTFDESELELFEAETSSEEDYVLEEESDSDLEPEATEQVDSVEVSNNDDSLIEEMSYQSESESNDEFSLESEPEIASESEDLMDEFIEGSEPAEEFSLDPTPEMSSESEEFSFEEMNFESESEPEDLMDELSLESEPAIAPESEDLMDEFIEESESAEGFSLDPTPEMSSESEEFSFEEMNFESESEPEDSMDEFISELSLDQTSNTDVEFENLMGAFDDDNRSIVTNNKSTTDLAELDSQLEDDNLESLESIDRKLDELTQVSDESLDELNNLMESVQENENELEEQHKLNEIYQDK